MKVEEVGTIDHVDRNVRGASARRHRLVARIGGGAHHGHHARQICRQRVVGIDIEPTRSSGRSRDGIGHVGMMTGIPAHGGVRRQQQAQLVQGVLAAADKHDRTAGDIHENRKKSHRARPENL
jgi:hypothetical protein